MSASVSGKYTEGRSSDRELAEVLRQSQKVLNYVQTRIAEVSTTGTGAATVLWFSEAELPYDTAAAFQVKVHGTSTTGAVYGCFEQAAVFFRGTSGGAAQLGATTDKHTPIRSGAGVTCSVALSGNRIAVTVNDGGGAAMAWKAWIEVRVS